MPHIPLAPLPGRRDRALNRPADISGVNPGTTMAAKRDKADDEFLGTAKENPALADALDRSREAILCLARLIGRQMAREQFEASRNAETSTEAAGKKL